MRMRVAKKVVFRVFDRYKGATWRTGTLHRAIKRIVGGRIVTVTIPPGNLDGNGVVAHV